MKQFNVPEFFKSPFIQHIKQKQKLDDPKKKSFDPIHLDLGSFELIFARHFGFCFGVENAIEIAYKALDENPGKRIFLLSQMIHNPDVNRDLEENGVKFLMETNGKRNFDWQQELTPGDIVLVPAFGTTLDIEKELTDLGIEISTYNTTCPFVERVWKKSDKLGRDGHTILIHGKPSHEETRATFSHSSSFGPSLVIQNLEEAQEIGDFMLGKKPWNSELFDSRCTEGFHPEKDLGKIGVVNQTTMLAEDTAEIVAYFKGITQELHGDEYKDHFAETRDTLCYATNDNQNSTKALLQAQADFALVVGGYNSSNTSHLVELLETKFSTYFIKNSEELDELGNIQHFHFRDKTLAQSTLPTSGKPRIILTSGASCPDSALEKVIQKLGLIYAKKELDLESILSS